MNDIEQIFDAASSKLAKDYRKKIVIYLDILGIKGFTCNTNTKDKDLCDVYQILKNVSEYLNSEAGWSNLNLLKFKSEEYELLIDHEKLDFSISLLSDSIIISFSKKFLFFFCHGFLE